MNEEERFRIELVEDKIPETIKPVVIDRVVDIYDQLMDGKLHKQFVTEQFNKNFRDLINFADELDDLYDRFDGRFTKILVNVILEEYGRYIGDE